MQLTVKEVEEDVYKEFKAEAVREGFKVGKALTMAMDMWLEGRKTKKSRFLQIKPWDWGPGTEKASEEVDEILHG